MGLWWKNIDHTYADQVVNSAQVEKPFAAARRDPCGKGGGGLAGVLHVRRCKRQNDVDRMRIWDGAGPDGGNPAPAPLATTTARVSFQRELRAARATPGDRRRGDQGGHRRRSPRPIRGYLADRNVFGAADGTEPACSLLRRRSASLWTQGAFERRDLRQECEDWHDRVAPGRV